MKTIFIVDDSDTNLSMAEAVLDDQYRVMTMPSASKMFSLLGKVAPDLILLDIEMPEMDGFETIKKLKAESSYADIPVMFLTGRNDPDVEAKGLELGAVDFVTKPFSAPVLLNRIKTHLGIDEIIRERTAQVRQLQNSIVAVLADMVESRDKGTGGHIERTSIYIQILLQKMKERSVYATEIGEWDIEKIVSSARMHDLGKISITDVIINKTGKLTEEEYDVMKKHAEEGERIIDEIISRTSEDEFLQYAKLFAGTHHERWDGKGYPRGLKENEIPLQGRIMAIVDVYDALVSERPYKKAFSDEEAIKIIMQNSGTHFDPKIASLFFEVKDHIKSAKADIACV
ncbi:MAG: response regulator [Treponema sp.]|jgi:putative two-component system response regulator|nr:response regulator [Treponema sp.]